jgi:response regulator RpfG family c-di-GMP phosphodiesterase
MRVVVASANAEATGWLEGVLLSAGLSVVILNDAKSTAPELAGSELLIADHQASTRIGRAGPDRRILLVPRGQPVGLADALSGGFMDLLVVPAPEDEVLTRVGRALDQFLKPVRTPSGAEAKTDELKEIVRRVTSALKHSSDVQEKAVHELAEGMLSVFVLLIDSHEATEQGTPGHSRRTGSLVRRLALALDRTEEEAAWLELAGRLHDIGHVPLTLKLVGEAPLSPQLRRSLEQHPRLGSDILGPLQEWGLPVDAILKHHERIDGSGYPKGLEGDKVSVDAQILGAADVYEAVTSPRPWRGAETPEAALDAIRTWGWFSEEVLAALEKVASSPPEPPGPLPSPPS